MLIFIFIIIFVLLSIFPIAFILSFIQSNHIFKKQFKILENDAGFKMVQQSPFHRPGLISETGDYRIILKPVIMGNFPKNKKLNVLAFSYTEEVSKMISSVDIILELEIIKKNKFPYKIKIDAFERSMEEIKDLNDSNGILTGDNQFDANFLLFGDKQVILQKMNSSVRKKLLEILEVSKKFTIMNKLTTCQIKYNYDENSSKAIMPLVQNFLEVLDDLK